MIGNLLSDQPLAPKRTTSMVPPGMGDLNYLQSLIASIANQELNTTASPTWVGGTFTGLTASLPIVTNASKGLASVSYATLKASLAIAQADVSGLTTASSPALTGLTLSGLTASVPVVTSAGKALASVTYAAFKSSLAIAQADVAGLTITDSPTHAGMTLTGFSGILKATTGVIGTVTIGAGLSFDGSTLTNTEAAGAVSSVFTRTGAVVAATNDYTWAQINKATSSIADITTRSHTSLTDIGTLTHATIDTYLDQSVKVAASPTFAGMLLNGTDLNGAIADCAAINPVYQATSSAAYYAAALGINPDIQVAGGVTNSGLIACLGMSAWRTNKGGTLDTGTLQTIYGLIYNVGHYGNESKTTNSVIGMYLACHHGAGTIGQYTGISLADGGGAGTVTTKYHIYADTFGLMYRGGSVTWDATSDIRIKRDVQDYQGGMDLIRQLQVKSYKYNGLGGTTNDNVERVGLVADDLVPVFPEATYLTKHATRIDPVKADKLAKEGKKIPKDVDDGIEYLGYSFDRILFTMLNALKEADARLSSLEKK